MSRNANVQSGGVVPKTNRTLIGILCIVIALVLVFLIAPLLQKSTGGTMEIIRLANDVKCGDFIEESDIEIVSVGVAGLPTDNPKIWLTPEHRNTILTGGDNGGPMYAGVDLYKGDYFNQDKLTHSNFASITAEDAFINDLNGSKVAVSVKLGGFDQMLSGKLRNGDIVSLIAKNEDTDIGVFLPELRYIQILTTTTEGGFDQNEVRPNEEGEIPLPVTFTAIVRREQAQLLVAPEKDEAFHIALVCRGTDPRAKTYLKAQDAYLDENYGPISDAAITDVPSSEAGWTFSETLSSSEEEVQVN